MLCASADEALQGADVLAVVTEWREFRSVDFERVVAALKEPAIFDGRNLYDPQQLKSLGIRYYAIGRGESLRASATEDSQRTQA
jgi:UDPglucose 6-dehydrogenase